MLASRRSIRIILAVWLILPVTGTADTYLSGLLQGLYGGGLDTHNPTASELTASETRLQLKLESFSEGAEFLGRLDFVYDDYDKSSLNWELREGFAKFTVGRNLDVKIGRQIITWGTGDLIFINDLFAKDYQSFFTGRDDQYLKAPHNAIRMSLYSGLGTFAVVYTPRFTPNRIPTGERLSYFDPMVPGVVGGEAFILNPQLPSATLKNGELAARFSRYAGSADVALYAYRGFYKNPVGFDPAAMAPIHPRLNVFGFSVRLPLLQGIGWIESGYYDSYSDRDGADPSIPNSSVSSMIGFERQLRPNLTANIQYQSEVMLNHGDYRSSLPAGSYELDEVYHLLTTRLTQLLMMETLTLSGFVFYSPSEQDFYGRLAVSYKHTDALTLAVGANLFEGKNDFTHFGSFRKNDNVYLKVTYGYN